MLFFPARPGLVEGFFRSQKRKFKLEQNELVILIIA